MFSTLRIHKSRECLLTLSGPKTANHLVKWQNLRTSRWRYLAGLAVLLIALVASYGTWVYSEARSVEKMLDRAEALDVSGIATGDDAALVAAQSLVDDSNDAVDSLSGKLGPIRVAEAMFGWVPWAGDQLDAPELLLDRADAALDTTEPLIAAADDLFLLRNFLANGDLAEDGGQFDALVRSLELNAEETSKRMERVTEAASAMNGLSLLGVFDRRANRVASLENRLLAFDRLLTESPSAITDARGVLTAGSEVTQLLSGSGDLDLKTVAAAVDELAVAAQGATASIERLEEMVVAASPGTDLADFTSALSQSVGAVGDLSAGLSTIIEIFGISAEILEDSEGSLLSNGDDLQRALVSLVLEKERLAAAIEQSATALAQLEEVIASDNSDFLSADLTDSLVDRTKKVLDAGSLMLNGPELLLSITGADSPKKYMVLGQTSDELRAAGGFTSSVWTLSFENGALTDTRFIPVLRFEDRRLLSQSPSPAAPLSFYMNTGALYLRDVGWEPDYMSVANLASDLYLLHRGEDIDGVFAVTQWGIIRLVEALGGIEVDGELISPDQVLTVIEQGTDNEGTAFLEQLFVGLLDSFSGKSFADPQFELLRALSDVIAEKDVMLFSADDEDQELIDALELSGRFPVSERDRIAIVDSNVGWSKSDRSIERSASYTVDLADPVNPLAELTLSYRNTGSEIGRDCSTHSPPHNEEAIYSVSRNSCYWNYLRAYVATGIDVTQSPDLPLPVNSVPDQQGRQEAGTSTFSHDFDEYGDHLAGLVAVPPGESVKFRFEYKLPSSILESTGNGFVYELTLVAQPGARGRRTAVELLLPEGYSLGATSHEPEFKSDGTVQFLFELVTDEVLRVELIANSV